MGLVSSPSSPIIFIYIPRGYKNTCHHRGLGSYYSVSALGSIWFILYINPQTHYTESYMRINIIVIIIMHALRPHCMDDLLARLKVMHSI